MRTLFLLGTCLLMAACTGRSSQASNDDETKPVITVTLEPQRYFTEAIAGDKFKVVSMVQIYFSAPNDILRYLWYKKTGFLQIIEPKTLIRKAGRNNAHLCNALDKSRSAAQA